MPGSRRPSYLALLSQACQGNEGRMCPLDDSADLGACGGTEVVTSALGNSSAPSKLLRLAQN